MYYSKSRSSYFHGSWASGHRHGTGVLVYASGAQYSGEWRHDAKTGQGTMTWPHLQQAYVGQWKHNKQHGVGTHVWGVPSGGPLQPMSTQAVSNRYEGSFKHGLRHGVGTFYYADGGSYFGGWRHGLKHGHGVLTAADGRVIQGRFCLDELPAAAAAGLSISTGGSARKGRTGGVVQHSAAMALTGTPSQPLAPSMGLHVGDLLPHPVHAPAAAAEHTRALNSIMMKWNSQLRSVYALYAQVNAKDASAMGRVAGVFPPTAHALLGLAGVGAEGNLLGAAAVQSMTLGDMWTFCLEAGLVRPPLTLAFVDNLLHLARMRHAVCLAEAAHTVQTADALRHTRRAAASVSDSKAADASTEGTPTPARASLASALRSLSPPGSGRGSAAHRMGDVTVQDAPPRRSTRGGVTMQLESKEVGEGKYEGGVEFAPQGESVAAALDRLDDGEDSDGGSSYASSVSSAWSQSSEGGADDMQGGRGAAAAQGAHARPASGTPRRRPVSAARGTRGAPAVVAEALQPVGAAADAYEALVYARRHAAEQPVLYREFLEVIVRLAALTAGGVGGVEYGVLAAAFGNDAFADDGDSVTPGDAAQLGNTGGIGDGGGAAGVAIAPLPSLVGSRWGASTIAPPHTATVGSMGSTGPTVALQDRASLLPGHNAGVGSASVALMRRRQQEGGAAKDPKGGYAYPGAGAWNETASTLALSKQGVPLQSLASSVPDRAGCTLREPPAKALPAAVASAHLTAASKAAGVAQRGGGGSLVPAIRSHFDVLSPGVLSVADALDAFAWGVLKPLLAREQQRATQRSAALAEVDAARGPAGGHSGVSSMPARPASHSPMSARRGPLTPQAAPPSPTTHGIHRPASWHSNWGASVDQLPSAGGASSGHKGGLPMWLQPRLHVTGLRAALRSEDFALVLAGQLDALRLLYVRYSSVDNSLPLMPGSSDADGPLLGAAASGTPEVQLQVQQDAGARCMTARDVARCLRDARLLDACFSARDVAALCLAAAFGDAAAPHAVGHKLWTDGIGGAESGAVHAAEVGLSDETPLDEVEEGDDEDDEEGGEGGLNAFEEDTGITDEPRLHLNTSDNGAVARLFGDGVGGLGESADGDDALLAAAAEEAPPLPALAAIPIQPVPIDAHSGGVQLLFPQFLEAMVRVCLAQYAVAGARSQQAKVVAAHSAAVAEAKQEVARLQAVAAEAAAAAAAKGSKGGKKKSKDAAAAEAAAAQPLVDLAVLRATPPTPAAHIVLDKPSAPLASKWSHFLQHTLLRRHKLGGVGQEDMAATLEEEAHM